MSMSCEDIREMISTMTDNELNDEDRALLMEHLAACPECMKVYEAFSSVSEMLADLEEVPEGFADSVMQKVHAQSRKPKQRFSVLRIAGLAACLALILFAGRNIGALRLGALSDDAISKESSAPPENGETAEGRNFESDMAEQVTAKLMDYGYVTLTDDSSLSDPPIPSPAGYFNTENDENKDAAQEENQLASSSVTDLTRTTDIQTLLQISSPAEYGLFAGEPDYTATFFSEDGSSESLSIWIDGDTLYCADDTSRSAYYAACTPEEFLSAFGQ